MSNATWILTADQCSARVFEKGETLQIVRTFEHEAARLRDRDVLTDRPGRAFDRATSARHAMGHTETQSDLSAQRFAHEVASWLDDAFIHHRFGSLIIAAEPRFLGRLRQALGDATTRGVARWVTKDLQHLSEPEVREHIGA